LSIKLIFYFSSREDINEKYDIKFALLKAFPPGGSTDPGWRAGANPKAPLEFVRPFHM
jgi:hypothetical protein